MLKRAVSGFRQAGVTLIELMVTLTVLAVLLAIAAPSFIDATLNGKLTTYANSVVGSAYLARSEATKRNGTVTMCVSSNGTSCGAGGWQQGWIILAPDGTTVLQWQQALAQGFVVTGSVSSVAFQPTGVGATAATFKVCRATPTVGKQERLVQISATGQPMVTTTTTGVCP